MSVAKEEFTEGAGDIVDPSDGFDEEISEDEIIRRDDGRDDFVNDDNDDEDESWERKHDKLVHSHDDDYDPYEENPYLRRESSPKSSPKVPYTSPLSPEVSEMCQLAGFDVKDWVHGTPADRKEITKKMLDLRRNGNEFQKQLAGDVMYELHRAFIWKIIKQRFSTYIGKYGEDLLQAASLGFTQALDNLDPNYLLITHLSPYILHHVSEFVAQNVNHTSPYRSTHIQKIYKAEQKLIKAGIENPEVHEIVAETGLSVVKVKMALAIRAGSQTRMIVENMNVEPTSISKNEHEISPVDSVLRLEADENLLKALESLPECEREVLVRKNGFGMPEQTMKQIERELGVPIEKIKFYHQHACRLLRKQDNLCHLHYDNYTRKKRRRYTPTIKADTATAQAILAEINAADERCSPSDTVKKLKTKRT